MTGLLPCPCCGCRTLASHGTFDICPVCFWEDDFTVDPESDLNPNNMCLFDARANVAAWGAVDPELVHWTRPATPDEAPEGFPCRGGRPYDHWPRLPVGDGVAFGWIGPSAPAGAVRDGFLVLDDGRRAGLRVRADHAAEARRASPADRVGSGRDGQFDVWLPAEVVDTLRMLEALRSGLAAELVAQLPGAPDPPPSAPRRLDLGTSRTYAGGGHGEVRWEASPDDPDAVAAWALAQLRTEMQPQEDLAVLGPREWVHRRITPGGLVIRGVAVHDVSGPLPPGAPTQPPPGTRCLVEWSSGSFPTAPSTPPPSSAPPPAARRRRWGRR